MQLRTCALVGVLIAAAASWAAASPPIGDTQGLVEAVMVRPNAGTGHSFVVWFKQIQNDRWSCLAQNGGNIVVNETAAGVTSASYRHLLAIALMAQASGKPLALDSAGTNPCSNVNMGWVVG